MNAENFIKNEAKKMLSGKWPIAFLSTLELLFLPIISILILMMAYSVAGDGEKIADALSGSSVNMVLFVVFHVAAVLALLLLSPVCAGFVRIFSGIADGKDVDPADLFYFFEDKSKYKNAVKFMTGVIVKCFGIFLLCSIVGIMLVSMSDEVSGGSISVVPGVVFLIIGVIIAFLLIHRFAFSVMLFSYYDYDPENAVSFGAKVAKGNTQKLINLTVSFVPWLLLTFFVVPFVYVYPYMTCSYFVSAKYLIQQYKEQFGDIANSYADQKFNLDLGMTNIPQADRTRTAVTQIPPMTEDRSRASHFPQIKNPLEDSEDKPEVKNEYDLDNFAEKKNSVTLEKNGVADSL